MFTLLGNCSYGYSAIQHQYTYCKYLGEELNKINTECEYILNGKPCANADMTKDNIVTF